MAQRGPLPNSPQGYATSVRVVTGRAWERVLGERTLSGSLRLAGDSDLMRCCRSRERPRAMLDGDLYT